MASATTFSAFTTALAAWNTTPLFYENEDYDLPGSPAAFVYVEIFGDTFNMETMGAPGANLWEEAGIAYLHVMVPAYSGTTTARTLATSLMNLFREQPVGSLIITEMSIGAGEPGREFPNYWALTLSIFWRRQDYPA